MLPEAESESTDVGNHDFAAAYVGLLLSRSLLHLLMMSESEESNNKVILIVGFSTILECWRCCYKS